MENIDITMTATIRPGIVEMTLDSINKYIIGQKKDYFRLIVNIDPIGEPGLKAKHVLSVIEEKFPNFIYNIPDKPSFPKAVKWVWEQSTTNFIFHIEDDWTFTKKIDVEKMMHVLSKYEDLSSLRLSKHKIPDSKIIKLFECKWRYIEEDEFYLAYDWRKQFGLNPILIKKEFINQALPRMVDHVNPEKQFRSTQQYMVPVISKWTYGLYAQPKTSSLAIDIGRRWKGKKIYTKPKKGTFTEWIKIGKE
jgi:hypothetical protein